MTKRALFDVMPIRLELVEADGAGKLVARGEFGRVDVPTSNNRRYGRKIIESNITRLSPLMESRRLFGEIDHPQDGKTSLKRVSHVITNLTVNEDGQVIGEAEILKTPNGMVLEALLRAGCEVGVSSRGVGSTVPSDDGYEDVTEDYEMKTFDFVADPAMKSAYPDIVQEAMNEAEEAMTFGGLSLDGLPDEVRASLVEEIEARAKADTDKVLAEAVEAAKDEAKAEFDAELEKLKAGLADDVAEEVEQLKDDLLEQARAEMLADPEVGAAKTVLEAIVGAIRPLMPPESAQLATANDKLVALTDALKAKDFEAAHAKMEAEGLEEAARVKLREARLKERLAGHPKAEAIAKMIGPVDRLQSDDELDERIESAFEAMGTVEDCLEAVKADALARADEIQDELDEATAASAELESKVESLRARLAKAVELGEALDEERQLAEAKARKAELVAHGARKLAGREDAAGVMKLLEGATSETEVDGIIRRAVRSDRLDEDETAARVRARVRRGMERDSLFEERKTKTPPDGGDRELDAVVHAPMSELTRLAGISN